MKLTRTRCAGFVAGLILASAIAGLTSCSSTMLKPPRWTVVVNPLDYVHFMCGEETTSNRVTQGLLKLELLGTGYLTCWSGRSPRVNNDFWKQQDDPVWEEYESDSVYVSASYVRACFQHLVDTGFFEPKRELPKRKGREKEVLPTGILVVACINGRKQAAVIDDPRIGASVRELLKQF